MDNTFDDSASKNDSGDELDTKDLAQRISSELKRYSIPQVGVLFWLWQQHNLH